MKVVKLSAVRAGRLTPRDFTGTQLC